MRGVDLNRYPFDFDLTFAALLMHPDGTVYHRYGGRDQRSAGVWLNTDSWTGLLRETLEEHAAYSKRPDPPPELPPLVIEHIPAFAKRDKGECIHCHSIFPAIYEQAKQEGTWESDDMWLHPPPSRIGLDVDPLRQAIVTAVGEGSVAARAALAPGDRLLAIGGQRIATASDLSHALHELPDETGEVRVEIERAGRTRTTTLSLAEGWKRGDPLSFSWRPFKWALLPAPGFGGQPLSAEEKVALELDADAFAFRVGYLVTWDENQRFGHEARRAGLRKRDVVVSIGGKRDFATVAHFHSWWRLTRTVGETVAVEVIRNERRRVLEVRVLE